jgi:molybdopterin-containing oxidoreductase family iron-sulfur binding subunit
MEKCTFCIQRIRRAEEQATAQGIALKDGDFEPACAQACPSDAIIFGLLSDPDSQVSHLARNARSQRLLLEELGTEPRVIYLKSERGSRR